MASRDSALRTWLVKATTCVGCGVRLPQVIAISSQARTWLVKATTCHLVWFVQLIWYGLFKL